VTFLICPYSDVFALYCSEKCFIELLRQLQNHKRILAAGEIKEAKESFARQTIIKSEALNH